MYANSYQCYQTFFCSVNFRILLKILSLVMQIHRFVIATSEKMLVFNSSEFMGRICDWFGFRLVFSDTEADTDTMCGILHEIVHYNLAYGSARVAASMAVIGGMCVRELAVAHTIPVSGFIHVFTFLSRVKNSPDVTKRHRLDVVLVLAKKYSLCHSRSELENC